MKSKLLNRNNLMAVLCLVGLTVVSCKKNAAIPAVDATRAQLTQDSIFLYAKQVYLWNTALPEYAAFNPRQYAGDINGFNKELYQLVQNSPINSVTGKPYEFPLYTDEATAFNAKYSYIDDISTHNTLAYIQNQKSSVDLEGVGNDFGLKLGAYGVGSAEQYAIYIQAVYPGSPAALKGLTRGAVITRINGTAYGANYTNEKVAVNNALNASTITIIGVLKDGITAFNYSLVKTTYSSSPIYATKIFTVAAAKVGYLAYARFSNLANSQAGFDAAFANFATAGVTKLVIDLRYNGGGYVNTAAYLVNLIAPAVLTGQVMFKERYNDLMKAGNAAILANQTLPDDDHSFRDSHNGRWPNYSDLAKDYFSEAKQTTNFSKVGPLQGVTDVVFIVTRGTASASELVINSLKGYPSTVKVQIVGSKSYGKPVGFFPITINYAQDAATKKETGFDVYYSMFQTTNARGEGDYFDGFTPDLLLNGDDAQHDFGDTNEINLAAALSRLGGTSSNVSTTMSIRGTTVNASAVTVKPLRDGAEFNGMITDRPKLK